MEYSPKFIEIPLNGSLYWVDENFSQIKANFDICLCIVLHRKSYKEGEVFFGEIVRFS